LYFRPHPCSAPPPSSCDFRVPGHPAMNINHATYACHPDAKRKDLRLLFCVGAPQNFQKAIFRAHSWQNTNQACSAAQAARR
jgi:hypothetical protein